LASRPDLELWPGDVRDFAFPPGQFRFVIHAAASGAASRNEERPDETLDVIITGTRRVLEFARQANVKKLLFTSSGAVYGSLPIDLTHVSEDYRGAPDPLLPQSAYGEGKRVAEHMCAVHANRTGCESKIARCFAFVGPHIPVDGRFAVGDFIHRALIGEPIKLRSSGGARRSYLYASDLAIWLWTILFRAPAGRAFNVGSSEPVSVAELAAVVSAVSGASFDKSGNGDGRDGLGGMSYVPSTTRAADELGLRADVPLAEAIARTLNWYRQTQ
jgi:dTDP-glucose 4,6-dehydratase